MVPRFELGLDSWADPAKRSAMNRLSIAEIAKITRIPAPTARRYASLFKEFLDGRKIGRVTKYPESSIPVFQKITNLYNEGLVTHEIEERLRHEVPRTIDMPARQAMPPATGFSGEISSTMTRLMDTLGQCLEVIADQKTVLDQQRDEIQELKKAFVLLARSHKRVKRVSDNALVMAESQSASPPLASVDQQSPDLDGLRQKDAELESMAESLVDDTTDIKSKLSILESELVRIRKDRREMEQYLLEKISKIDFNPNAKEDSS